MRFSVISDDLTGAGDCGAQLVGYGLDVSVMLQKGDLSGRQNAALVFNTDSRSVSGEEAYDRVKEVCEWIRHESFDVVYKKIDSTMRGNVGQEINAVYDVFQPDFVVIAPAYPRNGRQVIDGIHYFHGVPLHETEVGRDPKTPIADSDINRLICEQSGRSTGHVTFEDLRNGADHVGSKLASFREQGISYVTADAAEEADLQRLVQIMAKTSFSVVWVGSAGLMNYLPEALGLCKRTVDPISLPPHDQPVLLVVGSVSRIGREQLAVLRQQPGVTALELDATKAIAGEEQRSSEWNRLLQEAKAALESGNHVALYSSDKVEETRLAGLAQGYSAVEISDVVSRSIGELAALMIRSFEVRHLFLTGGDTAQQVMSRLGASEFHLFGEVEPGIPLGKLGKDKEFFAVTKAGSFGSEYVMLNAIKKLQGG